MKIKQPLKTPVVLLFLLVSSLLLLQTTHAFSVFDKDNSSEQAWLNLQDHMARLEAAPDFQSQFGVQKDIVSYQLALEQESIQSGKYVDYATGLEIELLDMDAFNALSLLLCSIDFGNFENALLYAKVGLGNSKAFAETNNFYNSSEPLLVEVSEKFNILQTDMLNVDASNPIVLDQINKDMEDYAQAVEKFAKAAHDYKKLELEDAVNIAAWTSEEQQLWQTFQSELTKKYTTACKNYFAQIPSNEGVTDPVQLQNNMERTQEINASVASFKLLEQGCLYEFLNVLISKRKDGDSSLKSFHKLQGKLGQFLKTIDVSNPRAVLQAQVDMLAYEKEVLTGGASK